FPSLPLPTCCCHTSLFVTLSPLLTFVGKSMCLIVNSYTGTDDATFENSTYMAADPASINTKLLRGQLQHTPPCLTLPLSPTSPFLCMRAFPHHVSGARHCGQRKRLNQSNEKCLNTGQSVSCHLAAWLLSWQYLFMYECVWSGEEWGCITPFQVC
uniref:Uncharacterized protein n=1 Tax=Oryzias latipes TaxID=8090 RepID=A0A3P9IP17_ORYLA